MQMHTLTSTNDHVMTNENDTTTTSTKVTPYYCKQNWRRILELTLPHMRNTRRKRSRLRKGSDQLDSVV